MRSTSSAFLIAALVVGCGGKKQDDKKQPADHASGNSMAKSGDDMKPEAVTKDPGAAGEVRPPTADDLAGYTQDIQGSGKLTATIDTSMGAFHCELYPDKAPMTVANFVGLATGKKPWTDPNTGATMKKPFFDGLIFHRVIPGFMIQGGDPLGQGTGDPGYKFDDEVNNGLTMQPGTLAMANAGTHGGHGSNGSQFFITEGAPGHLNNKHTIFGLCKEVDLVKQIEGVPRGPNDRPESPVSIKSITFAKG
ncbi:MAG TPA: peptidylprolyl isomerase [Kofleriaceae bacterium]|nr:peptidylprolyl isomerase [Kofleriaceae bacterium]